MSWLIDTNAWIGFFDGDSGFGSQAKETMLTEPENCHVSIASIWEAAIKVAIGKLKLPYDLVEELPRLLEENGFQELPISLEDALAVRDLPLLHGDPFDRLQCVQAQRRGWKMVSRDPIFDRYGLRRVW